MIESDSWGNNKRMWFSRLITLLRDIYTYLSWKYIFNSWYELLWQGTLGQLIQFELLSYLKSNSNFVHFSIFVSQKETLSSANSTNIIKQGYQTWPRLIQQEAHNQESFNQITHDFFGVNKGALSLKMDLSWSELISFVSSWAREGGREEGKELEEKITLTLKRVMTFSLRQRIKSHGILSLSLYYPSKTDSVTWFCNSGRGCRGVLSHQ